ncbi:PAAR-like domain-containing protein [Chitinimonas koreensis]|nr:PAAR-like domain-containing protein [Chitinimonas koreensis]
MFANTNLGVLNLGFPDVCLTPPLAIPIPYPNLTFSFFHIPSFFQLIIGGGLAENILTQGTISLGDFAGVMLGVASG